MQKNAAIFAIAFMTFFTSENVYASGEDTYLSNEVIQACEDSGQEYGICPELLMAIAEAESGGDQYAENGNCKGIMQVSEKWHKDRMERLGATDIYDVSGNIHVAADYLSELFAENEDIGAVLMIYSGNSSDYHNAVSKYAESVMERSEELERLHGK